MYPDISKPPFVKCLMNMMDCGRNKLILDYCMHSKSKWVVVHHADWPSDSITHFLSSFTISELPVSYDVFPESVISSTLILLRLRPPLSLTVVAYIASNLLANRERTDSDYLVIIDHWFECSISNIEASIRVVKHIAQLRRQDSCVA